MSSVPLPNWITLEALRNAKGAELRHWINQANTAAGRKVLTQQGRVNDLRKRLATHYGIDLDATDAPVAPITAPLTVDEDIKARQFAWVRDLGAEWEMTSSVGKEFRLTKPSPGESSARKAVVYMSHN
jgi:hypothetical protein